MGLPSYVKCISHSARILLLFSRSRSSSFSFFSLSVDSFVRLRFYLHNLTRPYLLFNYYDNFEINLTNSSIMLQLQQDIILAE